MKKYIVLVVSVFLSACTTASYTLNPRSHYDFPNSNIEPLGEAVGKASQVSLLFPPMPNGAIERQAIKAALSTQANSDLLINYVAETKVTTIPIFLPIYIMDYTVHGTAASMSVGMQKIN